ncbi:hypothetical protein [Acinetobacter sp. YH12238]|uniref:hypothetical protein n=1 Tax=Acinetobacter sp. YH12238 TaxID=2601165 RepID=UPI0015D3D48B|nr:hypothetical protein [Acinetobacter sp. YH12238]
MKANQFVKKFGWYEAKAFLSFDSEVEIVYTASFFDDLKRLVESHELVENWGGLDDAKFALQLVRYPERLKQAIADVESCMESGK